jgi:hypothetical protein
MSQIGAMMCNVTHRRAHRFQWGETMAANLIGILEQLLGSSDVLSRIGSLIGMSPDRTKTAIGGAVPAILAALVGLAQRPEGPDQLAATLRNQDPGLLDDLSGMLSGGREKALVDSGSSALTSLFGQSKVDGLAGALGKFAGLNQSSSTSLLGALAPAVLGALGREQRAQGLDSQGVARLLNDQKDNIARALPTGLASALGSTGLLSGVADRLGETVRPVSQAARATTADATRAATTTTAYQRTSGGGSALRWIIAGLVALAAIWAAYHYLFRDDVREAERQPTDTATQVGEPAENLMVGDVNVGQEATSLFERATTALNGVTDAASAEAALPQLTEINAGLDKLDGLVGQLPAAGKSALAALINGALPDLEALIAKVSDIPGVGEVIKSAADAMVAKLKAMAA